MSLRNHIAVTLDVTATQRWLLSIWPSEIVTPCIMVEYSPLWDIWRFQYPDNITTRGKGAVKLLIERIWREVVVAETKYYPSIFIGGLRNNKKTLSQDTGCPGRDSNRGTPEQKCGALSLNQLVRCLVDIDRFPTWLIFRTSRSKLHFPPKVCTHLQNCTLRYSTKDRHIHVAVMLGTVHCIRYLSINIKARAAP
jgi:hypothetical protein